MRTVINAILILFFRILAALNRVKGKTMSCESSLCKIWVKEKVIEIWLDGMVGLPQPYNDVEVVKKHPFLLRLRLWLAVKRIQRRNKKLTKFWLKNFSC